ncbi:DUF2568 domain-containing protein [Lysinibacter cavernae]|uniref:DUF2568 domain-containing protein n=1 Tax=Lysinibacter cavernae TaxID=1640652 RepID=A0A7X5R184_9MICO|nr:hypothetical protein [Lysinibacter cavernae]
MTTTATPQQLDTITIVRGIVHLALFAAIGAWGFLAWPLPWPGIATGVGSIILAILMWAVFLSPKPILHVDVYGRGLVELLLIAAAVVGLFMIDVTPIIPIALGVVAAATGLMAGLRSIK